MHRLHPLPWKLSKASGDPVEIHDANGSLVAGPLRLQVADYIISTVNATVIKPRQGRLRWRFKDGVWTVKVWGAAGASGEWRITDSRRSADRKQPFVLFKGKSRIDSFVTAEEAMHLAQHRVDTARKDKAIEVAVAIKDAWRD